MTRHYKRKRLIEADSRDSIKCNDLRKTLNSSERQSGKKECEDGLAEYDEQDLSDLRYQIEMQMAHDCYNKETEAARNGKPFNCTCSDPYKWSDEEVLKWHGLKKNGQEVQEN